MLSTKSQGYDVEPFSSRPILVRMLLVERSCATQAQRIRTLPSYSFAASDVSGVRRIEELFLGLRPKLPMLARITCIDTCSAMFARTEVAEACQAKDGTRCQPGKRACTPSLWRRCRRGRQPSSVVVDFRRHLSSLNLCCAFDFNLVCRYAAKY
jgi:hypothetical protein